VGRGLILVACACASAALAAAPAGAGPLRTAIADATHFGGPKQGAAFARTKASGATVVRLVLTWRSVAPQNPSPAFDATDPADPEYNWGWFDDQVRKAEGKGLDIIATVQGAPDFAQEAPANEEGTNRPNAAAYAAFATAATLRYKGNFDPAGGTAYLPAIRYWQAWNEPNRDYFLLPQYESGVMTSPALYRSLLNAFSDAVHAVNPDNRVVAGGLAPLGRTNKPAPLPFMRKLLSAPVRFDIWSHHPYTSGGPTHRAAGTGNISLGDLGDMRKVLNEAVRAGHVQSIGKVRFWVTEFSWDTKGPDPEAVPMRLHARWTAEALYRMWRNGVSLVTWFRIQDDPLKVSHYQSGLYTVKGTRKLSFRAFRFPFVAFRRPGRILVWGRTPTSKPGTVRLERRVGGRWRRIGIAHASPAGIFTRTVRTTARTGLVRAVFAGEKSVGFGLTPVPDRYVNPFGCGGGIAC